MAPLCILHLYFRRNVSFWSVGVWFMSRFISEISFHWFDVFLWRRSPGYLRCNIWSDDFESIVGVEHRQTVDIYTNRIRMNLQELEKKKIEFSILSKEFRRKNERVHLIRQLTIFRTSPIQASTRLCILITTFLIITLIWLVFLYCCDFNHFTRSQAIKPLRSKEVT